MHTHSRHCSALSKSEWCCMTMPQSGTCTNGGAGCSVHIHLVFIAHFCSFFAQSLITMCEQADFELGKLLSANGVGAASTHSDHALRAHSDQVSWSCIHCRSRVRARLWCRQCGRRNVPSVRRNGSRHGGDQTAPKSSNCHAHSYSMASDLVFLEDWEADGTESVSTNDSYREPSLHSSGQLHCTVSST